MTESLLQVEGWSVAFRTPGGDLQAVDRVSFRLAAGETVCMVGESGSGKSVTALSIMGLLEANTRTAGKILFEGVDLSTLSESSYQRYRGRRMGMIFQEPNTSLNPVRTVGEQIVEGVRLSRKVSRRSAWREAVELLDEMRVAEPARVARQYPHELSGGMNQRVMIAIALAGRPRLLLADEPTTALDMTVQREILDLLRRLKTERGLAILLITHDLGVVAEMADQVVVMYAGQVVEQGSREEVLRAPQHPYTRGLWQSMPRLDQTARPTPMAGTVPSARAWPTGCRFKGRCPQAFSKCAVDPQPLLAEGGARAACWLTGEEIPKTS